MPCLDTGYLLLNLTFQIFFRFDVMSSNYWLTETTRQCLYQIAHERVAACTGFPARCLHVTPRICLCRLAHHYQLQLFSVKSVLAAADELGGSTKQVQSVSLYSLCTSNQVFQNALLQQGHRPASLIQGSFASLCCTSWRSQPLSLLWLC